jgi:ribosome-associated translation inhibitor RaiA
MTDDQSINIDSRKLFNLGVNLLIAGFIRQKPEDAKKLFKDLKQGSQVTSGQLTSEQTGMAIPIKLELDRSEYRGQFNYPNFEASIKTMLQKFETEVRKDKELKDLHTLTNDATGGLLFNIPTGVKIGDDLNVLMMAVEPSEGYLAVKLLFMNPDQFTK